MGMFKKKATIEELMEAAKELTDEEKAVLIESLSGGEPPKETPDEPVPEANGEKGEQGGGENNAEPQDDGDNAPAPEEPAPNEEEGAENAKAAEEEMKALYVALEARVAALEKANEKAADEEVGTGDDDLAEGVFHKMPESYVEQAKKMRF